MREIMIDLGAEHLRRAREHADEVRREIALRKETGAPLISEATGAPLVVPDVPDVSPLAGWQAVVRILPRERLMQLEAEVESVYRAMKIAEEDTATPDEERIPRVGRLAAMSTRLAVDFLREACDMRDGDGLSVDADDLGGDFWTLYRLVKGAQSLSYEEKKRLAHSAPST
jgi:hypothetical protein